MLFIEYNLLLTIYFFTLKTSDLKSKLKKGYFSTLVPGPNSSLANFDKNFKDLTFFFLSFLNKKLHILDQRWFK